MDKTAVRYLLEKQAVSYKLVRDAARKRLDRFSTGSPRELHPLQKRTAEQTTRMLNNLDEAKVSVGAKRALEDLRWATKPSTYGQGTKFKIPSDKIIR